jgi:hypothetical protein
VPHEFNQAVQERCLRNVSLDTRRRQNRSAQLLSILEDLGLDVLAALQEVETLDNAVS